MAEYEVICDDETVASVSGPMETAYAEARRYFDQCKSECREYCSIEMINRETVRQFRK